MGKTLLYVVKANYCKDIVLFKLLFNLKYNVESWRMAYTDLRPVGGGLRLVYVHFLLRSHLLKTIHKQITIVTCVDCDSFTQITKVTFGLVVSAHVMPM